MRENGLGLPTRHEAEGHAEDERQQDGRKGKLQRGRQAGQDQLDSRLLVDIADAEISLEDAFQKQKELLVKRAIKAEIGDQPEAVFMRGFRRKQGFDRAAYQMKTNKHDHGHCQSDQYRLQQALDNP